MNVQPRHSLEELQTLYRTETDARMARRIQGVLLAKRGFTGPRIVEITGACRRAVQQWIAKYNRGGINELIDKPRCGAPRKLPSYVERQILKRIQAGPKPSDGFSVFNASAIQAMIEREYGVLYSLTGLHDWLHRMGFSYLAPRPRHEQSDPKAQEAFKKTSRGGWLKSPPNMAARE
jgi:transposase